MIVHWLFPPDLREGIGHRTKRNDRQYQESIVTGQDIRNIKRKVDDDMVMKHDNDATSVSLTVSELQQESFNPVLLFKPQGVILPEYATLSESSFVLAIQTEFQMHLFQRYGGKILCIDSTHGTNAYRFKLITCMVQDDFGQGKAHFCKVSAQQSPFHIIVNFPPIFPKWM